jgi:hypothetical protein
MTKARDIASAAPAPSTVSATELGYVDGVTSAIQTQLDAKTAKSTLTTTGDIYYASAANTPARLGIGSTDQILKVTAGVPAWGAAPTSGDNWTLLNAGGTSLSANPTTITGISAKNKIMIIVAGGSSTSNADSCYLEFNGTGDYLYIGLSQKFTSTYSAAEFNADNNMGSSTGGIFFAKMSNTGGGVFSGGVTITGCNASGVKAFQSVGGGSASGSSSQVHYVQQGVYTASASITEVSVKLANGFATFDAGTVYVYTTA